MGHEITSSNTPHSFAKKQRMNGHPARNFRRMKPGLSMETTSGEPSRCRVGNAATAWSNMVQAVEDGVHRRFVIGFAGRIWLLPPHLSRRTRERWGTRTADSSPAKSARSE